MENLRLIAHRGARNIVTENSLEALKLADRLDVDAIEFDVRLTKDKQPVLCHNANLKTVYGVDKKIGDITLEEALKIKSPGGTTIPTLKEALELKLNKVLALDIKERGSADIIYKTLKNSHIRTKWIVGSMFPDELTQFKRFYPRLQITLHTYKHPFKTIKLAEEIGASGVTLVLYLLNPLTYWLARRAGLKVLVYQNYVSFLFSSSLFIRILRLLYPKIVIISDRPDKVAHLFKKTTHE